MAKDTALALDYCYLPFVPSFYRYLFEKNKFEKSLQECLPWNLVVRRQPAALALSELMPSKAYTLSWRSLASRVWYISINSPRESSPDGLVAYFGRKIAPLIK